MNLTTSDRKFLAALKISDDLPKLESAYPKPEKFSPVASSFIGGDSEPMVPLSAVEQLSMGARITEDRLAECRRFLLHEEGRVQELTAALTRAHQATAAANVDRAQWRLRFVGMSFVALGVTIGFAYTLYVITGGR